MALIDVVKYNGGPDVFAWKYPREDMGTWTQLIVNESQEAVLFKGGKAHDLYMSGRYTLNTANIPILNNIINLPFGGDSPFKAEVWYVNKINSLDIKWGTASPIQLQDPKYNIFLPLRSFGQFGIQVEDSRKFLVKLVGTMFEFDKKNLVSYFRGLYLTKVKDCISSYLIHKEISVLEINAYLDEISEELKKKMIPVLAEYGLKLVNFYVNDINVPEDDSSVIKLKEALAKRAEMDIVGYSYAQERSFDTLEGAATNHGSAGSGIMGAGMGLGMGVGMGGSVGQQFSNMTREMKLDGESIECQNCTNKLSKNQRFCDKCGFDTKTDTIGKLNIIICSNCSGEYPNDVKFCPNCGNKYNPCPECKADIKENTNICNDCGYKVPSPCPECGEKIENTEAKFCSECGYSLVKKCTECGKKLDSNQKFCQECGTKA